MTEAVGSILIPSQTLLTIPLIRGDTSSAPPARNCSSGIAADSPKSLGIHPANTPLIASTTAKRSSSQIANFPQKIAVSRKARILP